jgi:hypothetical protein
MAKVSLVQTSSGIETALEQMAERGSKLVSFLDDHTFKQYKDAQAARWITQGASEGFPWADVKNQRAKERAFANAMSPPFVKHFASKTPKEKKVIRKNLSDRWQNNITDSGFAAQGKVVMVLSGRLIDAATGKSSNLLKVVSNSGIQVSIDASALPYAKYPAAKRPVMQFSSQTEQQMIDDVIRYLMTGDS